jgi:hypothetical protein
LLIQDIKKIVRRLCQLFRLFLFQFTYFHNVQCVEMYYETMLADEWFDLYTLRLSLLHEITVISIRRNVGEEIVSV